MLMKDDKKKTVAIILGRIGKKDEKMEEAPTKDGIEQDYSIPLESAAEEILSAIEGKNPKALVEAIKYFLEMCEDSDSKESDVPTEK